MGKKSIGIGIGQFVLIVLVWMLNLSAMVEQTVGLSLVLGVGGTVGIIAPIMISSTKDRWLFIWGIVFETLYVASLIILWNVIQYNIAI